MKIKMLFQLMWNTKKAKEHLYKITILNIYMPHSDVIRLLVTNTA